MFCSCNTGVADGSTCNRADGGNQVKPSELLFNRTSIGPRFLSNDQNKELANSLLMRSFVWVHQGPQVSLRVTDVPEDSRAELYVVTGNEGQGGTLLCSDFQLFVRDVRVTVFYSVVTQRNFGVVQSFLSDCPAFACSVFQVIKTKIKTTKRCADMRFQYFKEAKPTIQNNQRLWSICFLYKRFTCQ